MNDSAKLSEQPFLSHLVELRDRMMRMVLAVLVIFLGLFPFGNDIYVFIADPLMKVLPEGTSMIATQVASPFLTPFKLALVSAVFIAMPYLLHQFWAFIAPGLYQHEKRLALPLLASSILLFYLGAAFAYVVVFPLVFAFLTGVAPEGVAVMTDITHYLDFVLTLFFAFGIAFEVPIATIVLVLAGVTTPEKLGAKRPYVIVGAFVIGMLLTPPDIISQTLLALPMWILFEVGLLFARMVSRERQRKQQQEDDEDDGVAPAAAATAATAATAAAASADVVAEGEFKPLDEHEMDDEMDRIEREFDALDDTDTAAGDDVEDPADDAVDSAPADTSEHWTVDDSADMLDEEDFPERTATEALVDAKLEQVAAYRAMESYAEARRLLYEILSEGNEEQVRVARNILEQLDS
ncbi:MAG: twin-arginine translocase subunit TatC [Gammaproteobacteria bacterium]|nr:twin-arginine translocase subunit TatC [Gammaproteobacteria bacterium]